MSDSICFLYAEDYIDSAEYVREAILRSSEAEDGEFVELLGEHQYFEYSGDYRRFGLKDDFDTVFLFKSNLDPRSCE